MSAQKTALITGATSGIGLATARALAERGFRVLVHGRSRVKVAAALAQIRETASGAELEGFVADLGQLREVRRLAAEVLQTGGAPDVLINNAGVWNSVQEFTAEGLELTLAVNHLAYFELTRLLAPEMPASGRIVCVASDSHRQVKGFDFDNPNLDGRYHGLRSYAQSKLANVLFTYEYERRRPEHYPTIYAVQPGLVQTDIGVKGNTWLHRLAWRVRRRMKGNKTPLEGAATSIYLATAPDPEAPSGLYWDNCEPKKSFSSSYDSAEAAALWALTESWAVTSFL